MSRKLDDYDNLMNERLSRNRPQRIHIDSIILSKKIELPVAYRDSHKREQELRWKNSF